MSTTLKKNHEYCLTAHVTFFFQYLPLHTCRPCISKALLYPISCIYHDLFTHFFPESAVTTWPSCHPPFIHLVLNSQHHEIVLTTPSFLKHSVLFTFLIPTISWVSPDPCLFVLFFSSLWIIAYILLILITSWPRFSPNLQTVTGQIHSDIPLAAYVNFAQNWMFLVHTWPLSCYCVSMSMVHHLHNQTYHEPLCNYLLCKSWIKPLFPVSSHHTLSPIF